MRWKEGFRCPKCDSDQFTLIRPNHRRNAASRAPLFQCKSCHRQTSVTSGTIFHRSHISLSKWFSAIYLLSNDKRGLSATTIAKFVQVSYSTGWLMLNKLRKAMADRNGLYKLGGNVQVDEFFLGGESHGEGRRGKGTKQTNVLIGVSISNGAPTHCFMEVIKDTTAKSFKDVFVRRLDSDTKLISDGNPSYGVCARDLGLAHSITLSKDEQAHVTFKWLNILIGNCKKFIDGTYHGREEHKQLMPRGIRIPIQRKAL
ncbi:ISXO2-like transposase domain protein [Acidithrix ferrooxidans]|uniref:ISXO2-like transposase domain protein n=1 Tax=Acidithrix ferrooxidans TaxID=1280514 RepID=A0A0D8HC54_9ACTN|nr:ISXO2-like transposase domain protein [Acidithrix ferrooxidans]